MFTSDQINEIKNKLQLFGKKDSSFPKVDKCYSNDSIVILQDGSNKSISIDKLLNTISIKYIDKLIENLEEGLLKVRIVNSLPDIGNPAIIYLVPSTSPSSGNIYTEYLWVQDLNKYEVIGSIGGMDIDDSLSDTSINPVQNKVVTGELNKKQPKFAADYIATGDLNSIPITGGTLDLNGYLLIIEDTPTVSNDLTIANGYVTAGDTVSISPSLPIVFVNCDVDITNLTTVDNVEGYNSVLHYKGAAYSGNWSILNNEVETSFDAELNNTSTNAIQNKAVFNAIKDVNSSIGVIGSTVTDLKTDNTNIKRDVTTLMDKVFPFKVAVSIDKTLVQKGTTATANITIKAYQGDDITQVDTIIINGNEYHGNIPYTTQVTTTTNTTYNVRVEKENKSASGSVSIRFVNLSYSGVVASNFVVNAANVKALTSSLQGGRSRTLTFNLNNQKTCIAYPKEFGAAASIKDGNNFDYLASYIRTEVTIDGEAYYVYLLSSPTTITDFKQIIN